jgi:cellulose synthase/poly-beta-1,6-N-acetylglucosamine synthase-like glycosyltransferase
MINAVFLFLGLFYFTLILFFYIGILRERRREVRINGWKPFVSVLVPARNESGCIEPTLASLAQQTYPASQLEIIVINDNSTDRTGEVVKDYITRENLAHFQLLTHKNDDSKPTYKKTAIAYALEFARGEIIMTTDADCRVQPQWVESMVGHFETDTGMVAGLVSFMPEKEKTPFHKLQTLEFAGLVFAGVGAIGNRYPLICNGSNLSYRRVAFDAAGGFAGHEHIPSGDDDLFMQNLHRHTNWKVHYNLDPASVNYTRPVDSFADFLNQRARWASKGAHYPGFKTSLILLLIYLFYLALIILPPITLMGLFSWKLLLLAFGCKMFPEYLVIRQALSVLRRRKLKRWFLVAQTVHIPYIVLAGFGGFFKLFNWKKK